MKVCEVCCEEIDGKDGVNRCERHENVVRTPKKVKRQRVNRDQIMRDLGLVKVRGALGGTYYE